MLYLIEMIEEMGIYKIVNKDNGLFYLIRFDFSNGMKIKSLCEKYEIGYTTCRKIIDNKHPYNNDKKI